MSLQNEIKIKSLLQKWPQGVVATTAWLESLGISRQLQTRYLKSEWIERVGNGAYKRFEDPITWQGGLHALQKQAQIPVHVGGLTALTLQGFSHYLRLGREDVYLFSPLKTTLPGWFRNHEGWKDQIHHIKTSFLPGQPGLTEYEEKTFTLTISTPERAILECLFMAPEKMDLVECYQLMEGMANLRPKQLQELLEACQSIKASRLFLYMADKAKHPWLKYIKRESLNLGQGDRSLTRGGVYISDYKISVPRELAEL